ncbi:MULTISPECIES: hypothetical protein [unclassified Streptomyces]|uniref:hypothetical protein n=1 Tax=unclassified Streptomyces TaxID=2593676 RepID=UPI002E3624A4|nr:hypothetical protein [Streptomyces sp. NBC_01278]
MLIDIRKCRIVHRDIGNAGQQVPQGRVVTDLTVRTIRSMTASPASAAVGAGPTPVPPL